MKSLFLVCSIGLFTFACKNQERVSDAESLPAAAAFDTVIDGKKVGIVYLKNDAGMTAAVTNYGARMLALWVPDKDGKPVDVLLGLPGIHDYVQAKERFFGAVVGRFGNRIARGKFVLNGKEYHLDINNPPNTLHGGATGFHSRVWDMQQPDSQTVRLTYVSPDGEEGYPGTLTVQVEYKLTTDNQLLMNYEWNSDQLSVANITNHNFWNLNGEGSGSINQHLLQIPAANYTPVDSTLIPTGISTVAGTPFDFRKVRTIGQGMDTSDIQLKYGAGYDHNFVLDKGITSDTAWAGTITGDISGIEMRIVSTEPGLQFYGGNFMKSQHRLKNGSRDDFRTAFCLETQHFPDSPNQPAFPSTLVEPGRVYQSRTAYKFSTP